MALRVKSGEVPEGSVILTRTEAINYQWKQLKDWKPRSDIWPYTYGFGILGGLASFSGMLINTKFRKAMKFTKFGGFATLTATSLCPGVMACIFQMRYVAEAGFLPTDTCTLCIELRALVAQNASAIAYPMVLSPISNFLLAIRGQTHRIPHYKNWRELLTFCRLLYKPAVPTIALLCAVNSLAASFILYKQLDSLSYIRDVLNLETEMAQSEEELNNLF